MFKVLKDVGVENKAVIVRADFNVPLDDKGRIVEDDRIAAAVPTIKYLLGRNCKIILMSHLGRPNGRVVEKLRLDGVAVRLSALLKVKVRKLDACVGEGVKREVANMKSKDVVLLENLRFHAEEEENDENFAKELASLADVYVNDAFGASHRAHASVAAVTKFLPSCAGILLEKEINVISALLKNPERPFVAVLGGAKVSDKIKLIENMLKVVDKILIGGAVAFTFLKAEGYEVGASFVEEGFIDKAKRLVNNGKIVLQVDAVIADKFDNNAGGRTVSAGNIKKGWMGLDIGPETVKLFKGELDKAKTIVWNGPLGVSERANFAAGTVEIARHIAESSALTIVGGGDTLAAAKRAGVYGRFSHTSTGGGAMLEFLGDMALPAIEALEMEKSE